MHPLDTSLDRSWHEGRHGHKVKRRSSLDNSCLTSNNSFRQIITLDFFESPARQHRRLSLNPGNTVTTSFLAGTDHRPQMELDLDWHSSAHEPVLSHGNPRRFERGTSKLTESENSNETLITVDTEKDDDEISLNSGNSSNSSSDCDSFCDASFHEPADKDYLRNNLGASCFWNSQSSLVPDHEIKFNKDAVGAVMEEDEDEDEL
jgi:hypothetical protein